MREGESAATSTKTNIYIVQHTRLAQSDLRYTYSNVHQKSAKQGELKEQDTGAVENLPEKTRL